MNQRRRRRYSESRRPNCTRSLVVAVISVISLLIYIAYLWIAVLQEGDTGTFLGGTAVIAMFAAMGSLILGVKDSREDSYNRTSRTVGVVFPTIATMVWLALYFVGMILG